MPNIETILRDHVTLQVECIDRLYLSGYVPALQRPGQLAYFFRDHRGCFLPSPALLGQMTDRFVDSIKAFAKRHGIPVVHFDPKERKDDVFKRRLRRFKQREGVVFIGVAQEYDRAFRSKPRRRSNGSPAGFDFYRAKVGINQYYFYLVDRDWGPGFIKFSSYAPFNVRVCINGHEWLKSQLAQEGIDFEPLDNGFRSCADPARLQHLADTLGPQHIERFFRRWLARLPHPFTPKDRAANYRYLLSIWQMEFSQTQVLDHPVAGRQLFEEIIRENLDLGRPDRIQLLFDRRITRTGKHPTPSSFRTRVVQYGVLPKLSVEYKHSRLKQYFKENRALRTETVINNTYDLDVGRSLSNLPYLRTIARNINHRLIAMERISHNCVIAPRTFESLVLPADVDGQHVPALRFGDPRLMAVLAALCIFTPVHDGFSNQMLRQRIAGLYDPGPRGYGPSRMTYDLRRLRLRGIIQRLHGKNRYVLTPLGRRVALFFSRAHARVLRPGLARIDPDLPLDSSDPLATSFRRLDRHIDALVDQAHLAA
jgi:hypothetical protein